MLYSIVGMLVIILDQAVKYWVSNTLFGYDVVKFIPGVISLVNVHNDGAAFSFMSGGGARIYFIIVTGVFAVLVVIALASNFISTPVARWSLVFVTAGGLGNMIDRIMYGYVQDMFKVELFNFAIFNVADIFITVFAIVFVLAMFFEKPKTDEDEEWEDEEEEEELPAEEKPAKSRKRSLKRKNKDISDDESASAIPAAKRSRQEKYENQQAEKSQSREAVKKPAQARQAEDPFAEWERANARVDAQRSNNFASKAMEKEAPRNTPRPAERPVNRPVEKPVSRPVEKPAAQPVKPAAPAKTNDSFDLDDILAEFK